MTSSFVLVNGNGTFGFGAEGFNTPLIECTPLSSLSVLANNGDYLAESGGVYIILRRATL